jgi:hypothetical protein
LSIFPHLEEDTTTTAKGMMGILLIDTLLQRTVQDSELRTIGKYGVGKLSFAITKYLKQSTYKEEKFM